MSITHLENGSSVALARRFHVEMLRGGMNRLLLRALPTPQAPSRVEVLFQYAQHLDIPMDFDPLEIADVTGTEPGPGGDILARFPECRVYRLSSAGQPVGQVIAAACAFGEDDESPHAESMFPMMG